MAKKTEARPAKKSKVIVSISQVFRNLSISVNLTVYAIYLIYLIYSIYADIGIMVINIALAIVTAAFMIVYLVLRLSDKKKGEQLKRIKHYYKNFKLIARTVSALTAVYALATAVSAVSPLAIIISFLGAVFLIIRLIVELLLHFIKKKMRQVKDSIVGRFSKLNEEDGDEDEYSDDEDSAEEEPRHRAKRSGRKVPKYRRTKKSDGDKEDIIIPVDRCLLNDIDE